MSGEDWYALLSPQPTILPPQVGQSDLAWSEMLAKNLWLVLAHTDCTKGAVVVWECYQSDPLTQTSLYHDLIRNGGLASASTDHSPSENGALRFGWCWNVGKIMSRFSTHWLYNRCCGGQAVLREWSHTYNKPFTCLKRNVRPCFHLNRPFSHHKWANQIWLDLKYWPIHKLF